MKIGARVRVKEYSTNAGKYRVCGTVIAFKKFRYRSNNSEIAVIRWDSGLTSDWFSFLLEEICDPNDIMKEIV